MSERGHALRHGADDAKFAAAIMRCEGFAPNCSYLGRCERGGECFASPAHLVAARMIDRLARSDQAGRHIAYLRRCSDLLRQGAIES